MCKAGILYSWSSNTSQLHFPRHYWQQWCVRANHTHGPSPASTGQEQQTGSSWKEDSSARENLRESWTFTAGIWKRQPGKVGIFSPSKVKQKSKPLWLQLAFCSAALSSCSPYPALTKHAEEKGGLRSDSVPVICFLDDLEQVLGFSVPHFPPISWTDSTPCRLSHPWHHCTLSHIIWGLCMEESVLCLVGHSLDLHCQYCPYVSQSWPPKNHLDFAK